MMVELLTEIMDGFVKHYFWVKAVLLWWLLPYPVAAAVPPSRKKHSKSVYNINACAHIFFFFLNYWP